MMMKMVHHNHHHRPLTPFDNDSCVGGGDGDGPTTSMSMSMTMPVTHNHHHNINDVVSGGSASAAAAAAIHSGGAAVRTLQPFDISTHPAFKSPGAMAASMGFPFTSAQWKELQRQAMIYKYMMASIPVPPHLLISTSSLLTPASRSSLDSGFNLRLSSNSSDPEPGRCRRTDGKKWRCSRDVAPNHKYCERHMHRGRPRSRKPVEVQANSNNSNHQIKRARQDYQHPFPTSLVTVAVSNPTITNGGSSSSQFLTTTATQSYHESSLLSLDKYGVKASNFEPLPSVPSDAQPRGLGWMLKGDPISMAASDPEWQPLMQNRVGLTNQSSCNNNASSSSPNFEETLYLNSYASFNSGLDQQNRRCPPFLNPLIVPMENPESQNPRGFIDAWSNAETGENNNTSANKSPVSSNAKLSLSSLDLSMGGSGGGSMVDEEMGTIQMGLGLMEPDDGNTENGAKTHLCNWLTPTPWVGSTPGGPLAEVLRPSTVAAANEAASDPSSPLVANAESGSPLATMVSSPSGVLQKTLASMSDSSSNSSPTVASSRANSEIGLLWFNKAN